MATRLIHSWCNFVLVQVEYIDPNLSSLNRGINQESSLLHLDRIERCMLDIVFVPILPFRDSGLSYCWLLIKLETNVSLAN